MTLEPAAKCVEISKIVFFDQLEDARHPANLMMSRVNDMEKELLGRGGNPAGRVTAVRFDVVEGVLRIYMRMPMKVTP